MLVSHWIIAWAVGEIDLVSLVAFTPLSSRCLDVFGRVESLRRGNDPFFTP